MQEPPFRAVLFFWGICREYQGNIFSPLPYNKIIRSERL
nr:MAG TPA: hypothetical protein [Caudoviricetes sp.]